MQQAQCCVAAFDLLLSVPQDYLPFRKQEILPCSERVNAMFLSHLVGVYRQWRRYNRSLRELNRLGDRELADIGITRGDIPRVAWESSEH
jgi:uncharacterized protein YjiS (DUF1127 family)